MTTSCSTTNALSQALIPYESAESIIQKSFARFEQRQAPKKPIATSTICLAPRPEASEIKVQEKPHNLFNVTRGAFSRLQNLFSPSEASSAPDISSNSLSGQARMVMSLTRFLGCLILTKLSSFPVLYKNGMEYAIKKGFPHFREDFAIAQICEKNGIKLNDPLTSNSIEKIKQIVLSFLELMMTGEDAAQDVIPFITAFSAVTILNVFPDNDPRLNKLITKVFDDADSRAVFEQASISVPRELSPYEAIKKLSEICIRFVKIDQRKDSKLTGPELDLKAYCDRLRSTSEFSTFLSGFIDLLSEGAEAKSQISEV
jgi:hypothetical protein